MLGCIVEREKKVSCIKVITSGQSLGAKRNWLMEHTDFIHLFRMTYIPLPNGFRLVYFLSKFYKGKQKCSDRNITLTRQPNRRYLVVLFSEGGEGLQNGNKWYLLSLFNAISWSVRFCFNIKFRFLFNHKSFYNS